MNTSEVATLEISYPKALLITIPWMGCFAGGLFVIGIPMTDPLVVGFLVVMVAGMTFAFAGCLCFILRCKIGRDGLRSAVPAFYRRLLRWEDISAVLTNRELVWKLCPSEAETHSQRSEMGIGGFFPGQSSDEVQDLLQVLTGVWSSAFSPNNAVLTAKDAKYAKADQGVDSLGRHGIAVTGN